MYLLAQGILKMKIDVFTTRNELMEKNPPNDNWIYLYTVFIFWSSYPLIACQMQQEIDHSKYFCL